MRRVVPMVMVATLAACAPKAPAVVAPGTIEARTSAAKSAVPMQTVVLTAEVRGPRAGIVQNHVAGVMANHGASLVPSGGSNLVPQGGASLVANNAARRSLLGLDELVEPIAGAKVECVDVAGRPVAAAVTTDAQGRARLAVQTRGVIVLLRVRYEVDGNAITLGGLAAVAATAPVAVDPATTFVAKRVDDLRRRGGIAVEGLSATAFEQAAKAIAPRLGEEAVVAAGVLAAEDASKTFEAFRKADAQLEAALAAATGGQAGLGAAEAPAPVASAETTSAFALPGEPNAATPAPEQTFAPPPPPAEPSPTPAITPTPRPNEPTATPTPKSTTVPPSATPTPRPTERPPAGTNGDFQALLAAANDLASRGKGGEADDKYDAALHATSSSAACLDVATAARSYGRNMAGDEALEHAIEYAKTVAESQAAGIKAAGWGRGLIADDAFSQAKDQCRTFDEALALCDVVNVHRHAQLDEIFDRVYELTTTVDQALSAADKAEAQSQLGERDDGYEKATALVATHTQGINVALRCMSDGRGSLADDAYKRGADKATTAAQAREVEASARAQSRRNAGDYAAQRAVALGG